MGPDAMIDLFRHALYIVMLSVAVFVVPGLAMGLLIAVFQAATQINESTISFLPKLFVILLTIALASPWMFNLLSEFTRSIFMDIPYMIS